MSISKKLRFEIFKRDIFTCQYCGQSVPSVVLEIDHVRPLAKGGTDAEENLLTSCFDCNRGKSDNLLEKTIPGSAEKASRIAEAEAQLKAYLSTVRAKRKRENKNIAEVEAVFTEAFPGWEFSERFRDGVRTNFLPRLDVFRLIDAMGIATRNITDRSRCLRYFCGVCWNMIRRDEENAG